MTLLTDPVDRAYWHLALDPELLYADQRDAAVEVTPPSWPQDDDDYENFDEDRTCEYCGGDGGDPWNDYILECPSCLGEGVRY